MPDQEQFADLIFPLHGISLLQGFGMQTPGTTPVGQNVRTFEVLTQRGRGGSRPGLARYIPAQLPNGPHKIQMLNVVVDPGGGALGDIDDGDFDDPSDAGPRRLWGIYFTRSPRRRIRRGGHGYMTYKNRKTKQPIMRVQQNVVVPPRNSTAMMLQTPFTQEVTQGNLLVVVTPFAALANISDSCGNTYQAVNFGPGNPRMFYYAIANQTSTCTVTLNTAPQIVNNGLEIIEYSGVSKTSPLDSFSFFSPSSFTTAWTTGSVPVTNPNSLVLGAFFLGTFTNPASFNPDSQFNTVLPAITDVGPSPVLEGYNSFFVAEGLPVNGATAVTGTGTNTNNFDAWGVSFRPM